MKKHRPISSILIVSALITTAVLSFMLYWNENAQIDSHDHSELDRGTGTVADPFIIYDVIDLSMVGHGENNPEGYVEWTLDKNYRLANDIIFDPNDPAHDTNGKIAMRVLVNYDTDDVIVTVTGPSDVSSLNVWLGMDSSTNNSGTVTIGKPDTSGKYIVSIGGKLADGTAFAYAFELDTSDITGLEKEFDGNGNFDPIGIFDLEDMSKAFSGSFDGAGYKISGMNVASVFSSPDMTLAGLFGYAYEAVIKDLGVVGGYSVAVRTSIEFPIACAGGIIGYAVSSSISNCYNTSVVVSSSLIYAEAGGVIGYADETPIFKCYNSGSVAASVSLSSRQACAGGIAGTTTNSHVTECFNTGNVAASKTNSSAGGITGYSESLILRCYNAGDIVASSVESDPTLMAGGVAAYSGDHIIDCYNVGTVKAVSPFTTTSARVGGISGKTASEIMKSYNAGYIDVTLSANAYAGGVAGYADTESSIVSSYFLDESAIQMIGNPQGGVDTLSGARSPSDMRIDATFVDWDLIGTWSIENDINEGFPILNAFLFDLVLNVSGNGSVAGPDRIYGGTNAVVTITPDHGYDATSVIDNGTDVTDDVSSDTYVISNIFADRVITVTFGNAIPISNVGLGSCDNFLLIVTCILLAVSILSLIVIFERRELK